jgi:uncharacterized OB-fold protein
MNRPLPCATAETKPFWDGCAIGELRYQACGRCGHVQAIPRAFCSACQDRNLQWRVSSGRGRVLSHTTVHRAPTPAFRADAPYVIALVDMDEGFRLMVNVEGGESSGVAIGRTVRIGFREIDGVGLPHAEVVE